LQGLERRQAAGLTERLAHEEWARAHAETIIAVGRKFGNRALISADE
jgi:hypothetical protein